MSEKRVGVNVGKKILAPGKGSEISHLMSWVDADAPFPKPVCQLSCIQVLNSRNAGLKTS